MSYARTRKRFLQFNVRQVLLLVAVLSVLLAVWMPRMHRALHFARLQDDARRIQAASRDLIAAIQTNDVDGARQALEAGAIADNTPEPHSPSLLCKAISKGQVEIMELLLDYGANPNGAKTSPTRRSGAPLRTAVECQFPNEIRFEMIRRLIARGADPLAQSGNDTPMDLAVRAYDAQVGALLREYGALYGPREMAAFNRLDELKQAVAADSEIVRKRFKPVWAAEPGAGPTLLSIALRGGHREMALFLIESGAPLDSIVYQKSTLLHQAARGGDPELIRLLVASGLDVGAKDVYSDTPLTVAAANGQAAAVASLLESGSDVNHREGSGRTALWYAIYDDRLDIVQILLAAGADPLLADDKCVTPLDFARTRGIAIAEVLQDALKEKTHAP